MSPIFKAGCPSDARAAFISDSPAPVTTIVFAGRKPLRVYSNCFEHSVCCPYSHAATLVITIPPATADIEPSPKVPNTPDPVSSKFDAIAFPDGSLAGSAVDFGRLPPVV